MKKIYLCAMALSVGSLSFGQQIEKKEFQEARLQKIMIDGTTPSQATNTNKKAPGEVLWSEDFSGSSSLPAGWTVIDNTNNNAFWKVDPAGFVPESDAVGADFVATIASTSGGNHIALPMDFYETPAPAGGYYDMDTYFQTSAIPLVAVNGISVTFQQKFRRCCGITPAPVSVVSVSTDPLFTTSMEYDIILGVAGNVTSADPMDVSINVTEAIPANYTGDIYLRFHIVSGSEAYYWMIDDIAVVESPTNDLVTSAGSASFFGVEYSRIPTSQVQPMSASMIYNNIGAADQTNSNLTVTINDGSTDTEFSTPNITISSLEVDTLYLDSIWTPTPTVGTTYTVSIDVLSEDSTDITPGNNTLTMAPFTITDGIMALDDYTISGSSSGGNGPGGVTEYEAGNQFDCTVDAPLYAIEVVTGNGTPVGTFIDVVLYSLEFTTTEVIYTEAWRSVSYAITADDLDNPKKFYEVAGTPIYNMVANGTYIAAVHSFVDYEYGTSGNGPLPGTPTASHSRIGYPNLINPNANSSFNLSSTPMIRLDLKTTPVGIEEGKATANFSVYPNPSNGNFTINLNNDVKTAVISVKNVVGQTILNKTVNVTGRTTESISLADYSKGVYFLTVNDETVKLIIE